MHSKVYELLIIAFLSFKMVTSSQKSAQEFSVVSTTQNPMNCNQDLFKQLFSKIEELEIMFQQSRKQLEQRCECLPQNCKEVQDKVGKISGVYTIKPRLAPEPFQVFCDMKTSGGGWTYVLNRFNGFQNFHLKWNDYKVGFGNLVGEHWLGLEHLYQLTGSQSSELLVELVDWNLKKTYAHYKDFGIGNESEAYNLKTLGGFNGAAGDSLRQHAGYKFSTVDNDHSNKCAERFKGGWWYAGCFYCHLTGPYEQRGPLPESEMFKGMHWYTFHGNRYSNKQARMMVRPKVIGGANKLPQEI